MNIMAEFEEFEMAIASPPDREFLVAQILFGGEQWAEINQEEESLVVEFYPRENGTPWRFPVDEAIAALTSARDALINYDPRESPFFKDLSAADRRLFFGDEPE